MLGGKTGLCVTQIDSIRSFIVRFQLGTGASFGFIAV